jgi:hypothetical protein
MEFNVKSKRNGVMFSAPSDVSLTHTEDGSMAEATLPVGRYELDVRFDSIRITKIRPFGLEWKGTKSETFISIPCPDGCGYVDISGIYTISLKGNTQGRGNLRVKKVLDRHKNVIGVEAQMVGKEE